VSGPKTTLWEIEPHTRAKHLILQRYLHAWLPIISSKRGRVVFIDGFAGPGEYAGGEEGSPVIAMRALIDHAYGHAIRSEVHFIFIEADKKRAAHLERVVDPLRQKLQTGSTATVYHGEYAPLLSKALDQFEANGLQLAPSLVFIDPFGVKGLPIELVRRVLATPSCEVMVNFMMGFMHRFIGAPEFERHMDDIFGTTEWRRGRGLQEQACVTYLRELYLAELTKPGVQGRARYVRAFTMLNKHDRPIYDLIFATNHTQGIDKLKDALWRVDAFGGERFSDATSPEQPTLLDPKSAHEDGLIAMLRKTFSGRTVTWAEVTECIRQSPYRIRVTPITKAAKDPKSGVTIIGRGHGMDPTTLISFS
jgi:three-Cys-motif partner protein